jgi:hypothetical protein
MVLTTVNTICKNVCSLKRRKRALLPQRHASWLSIRYLNIEFQVMSSIDTGPIPQVIYSFALTQSVQSDQVRLQSQSGRLTHQHSPLSGIDNTSTQQQECNSLNTVDTQPPFSHKNWGAARLMVCLWLQSQCVNQWCLAIPFQRSPSSFLSVALSTTPKRISTSMPLFVTAHPRARAPPNNPSQRAR